RPGQEACFKSHTQSKTRLPVVLPGEPYTRGSATNLGLVLRVSTWRSIFALLMTAASGLAESVVAGRIVDSDGRAVPGAVVRLETASGFAIATITDADGRYRFEHAPDGEFQITTEAQHQSIVITASIVEPATDLRNAEVFNRTLFTRDDQGAVED